MVRMAQYRCGIGSPSVAFMLVSIRRAEVSGSVRLSPQTPG
jgi:hypothetical protein